MVEYYILVDCDRIQESVFASFYLREICNASALLDWIETKVLVSRVEALNGTIIRSGGGVVLARFVDRKEKDQFRWEAPAQYRRYGFSATAVEHSVSAPVNDFYQEVVVPLQHELRRKKDAPIGAGLHVSTLLAVPCESSGVGPASSVVDLPDGETRRVRQSESEKRRFSQQGQETIETRLQRELGFKIPYDFGGLVGWTEKEDLKERALPGTSEQRVLGIVRADVNSLGNRLSEVSHTVDRYAAFSCGLRQTIEKVLYEAIHETLSIPVDKRKKQAGHSLRADTALPVRVLYVGGDDLAVAIQGCYAIDLVISLLEHFEAESAGLLASFELEQTTHLTMSAGVVLAPYNYPVQSFLQLGQDLERRAKRFGRRLNQISPPSLVDFYLAKNNAMGSLSQLRAPQQVLSFRDNVAPLLLFGGPYTPRQLRTMRRGIMNLSMQSFPRNKWKELREIFYIGDLDNAEYQYLQWWSSLGQRSLQTLFKNTVCDALGLQPPPNGLPTWDSEKLPTPEAANQMANATPLIDMVELSDLIAKTP